MEGLRVTFIFLFIASILHQAPASVGLGNKVLHIPEKIIGGVIDIVQSHKNKPSQQSTFQQSVQTQTTFSQHGNPQGVAGNGQQWTGPVQQGAGFQGQAQFQTQIGYGNQATGNIQGTPTQYPVNSGPYQQQGFSQSQNQEQFQNHQNQFQNQNQNQQGNYQTQNQNQGQNQNGQYQSGQYGTSNFQGTGQYVSTNGNYQNVGQTGGSFQNGQSSGNFQGGGQGNNGNYQVSGQGSSGNYQTVGQGSGGNYQNGNYQNIQTGQYQGSNGQYNQNQSGFQGSQSGQSSSGSNTGNVGSQIGSVQSSQQSGSGGQGPTCICQAWSKPPALNDEPPKSDKDKRTNDKKPDI